MALSVCANCLPYQKPDKVQERPKGLQERCWRSIHPSIPPESLEEGCAVG